MKPDSKRAFCDYIRLSKKLKSTRQRSLILDAFLRHGRCLSVDELYWELRTKHRNIGYSTVYRTLKLLAASGIAREIRTGDNATRYVARDERHTQVQRVSPG